MHYTEVNIVSYCTHAIFDEELFSKCTNSYAKEHKLYNKLLDKISLETKSLVPDSFGKDRSAPVSTLHTHIHPIQSNLPTSSFLPLLSYKFIFLHLPQNLKSLQ